MTTAQPTEAFWAEVDALASEDSQQPDEFTARQYGEHIGKSPWTARCRLNRLVAQGKMTTRRVGSLVYYRPGDWPVKGKG